MRRLWVDCEPWSDLPGELPRYGCDHLEAAGVGVLSAVLPCNSLAIAQVSDGDGYTSHLCADHLGVTA